MKIARLLACIAALLPTLVLAADPLPEPVFAEDMTHVIVFDFTRFNSAQFSIAAKAVLADKANIAAPIVNELKQIQGPMDAGLLRMVEAASIKPDGHSGMPLVYIAAKPGTDKAVQQAMAKMFGNMAKFETAGAWTKLRFGNEPATRPAAAKTSTLAEALAAAGEPPLTWVVLPSDATRKQLAAELAGLPAPLRDLLTMGLKGRYIVFTATLGDTPALQATAAMPDEASATKLEAAVAALPDSRALELLPFKPMFAQVKTQREGLNVRVTLDTAQLAAIGKLGAPMIEALQAAQAEQARRDTQPLPDAETSAAAAQMRLLLAQIKTFDQQKGRLPNDLDELLNSGLVPDNGIYEMVNPRTLEERGFLYTKPAGANQLADVKAPATTPLLRESLDGKPAPDTLIGYADGHVEVPAKPAHAK